jgi:hypothetical protein
VAKKQFHLVIDDRLVSEPFLYHLVKLFDPVPSVRSAMVEKGRISMVLELASDDEAAIQQGINYMSDLGISVAHVHGDVMGS